MQTQAGKKIEHCRICQSSLLPLFSLGNMSLSGIFLTNGKLVPSADLDLKICNSPLCSLVQLGQQFNPAQLFTSTYGYKSALNPHMVGHLKNLANMARKYLRPGDRVLDIGCNDTTFLKLLKQRSSVICEGVDPIAKSLVAEDEQINYHNMCFEDFPLDQQNLASYSLVSSFAVFYDFEAPLDVANRIFQLLKPGGHWILEVAYLRDLVKMNGFDVICHEHATYFNTRQIAHLAQKIGLELVSLERTSTNGASILAVLQRPKRCTPARPISKVQHQVLYDELKHAAQDFNLLFNWKKKIEAMAKGLKTKVREAKKMGKKVAGVGASTKGNIILQMAGLGADDIFAIGEVNSDKLGKQTPGTCIPIIAENELFAARPDMLIVFPWHFHSFFQQRIHALGYTGEVVYPILSKQTDADLSWQEIHGI